MVLCVAYPMFCKELYYNNVMEIKEMEKTYEILCLSDDEEL